ncbi:MAG: hypothetical protein KIC92_09465 [Clostridiales bacterium]|nr:hypothetical protein [Clostridiales bacterium]
MNIKKINSIINLRQEVDMLEKEIEKRKNNSYIKSSRANIGKANKISNPTLKYSLEELELPMLIKYLEEHKQKCLDEVEQLTKFILNIEDVYIRKICTLKYIYGVKNWSKIALEIGGGNTPDGVRMAHNRYFRTYKTNKRYM